MSVVLRCPTCGTTQGHAGECEACSEGEVQYFCTSHDEGIWLEGPVCSRCGAKFGDAPKKPPASRASSAPTRSAGPPDFRPPGRRRTSERPPGPEFRRRLPDLSERKEPLAPAEREEPPAPEVLPRTPTLGELFEELTEARTRAGGRDEFEVPSAEPRAHRPGFPLAGCLVRVVGLVFVLIVGAILFLFLLFGGFLID